MFSIAFEMGFLRTVLFCLVLFFNVIALCSVNNLPQSASKFHVATAEDVDEIETMRKILATLGINIKHLDKAGIAKKFNELRDEWVARHPGTVPDDFYVMYDFREPEIAFYIRTGRLF